MISFYKVNTNVSPPAIEYCLNIKESFGYEIFCHNVNVNVNEILPKEATRPTKVNSFEFLQKLIVSLEEKKRHPTLEEKIDGIVKEIKSLEVDEKKKEFLCEQLRLLSKNPHQRRYSPDTLALACMWLSVSPALYKQILADGVIQLPCEGYVRRLTGAVTADLTLSDATVAYLKARMSKLRPKDFATNLILDEVFAFKTVQYTNGKFYGNENNSITKTLLCAEKIHKVWKDAVEKLTTMGFNVVATIADNHNSNMKHFKKIQEKTSKTKILYLSLFLEELLRHMIVYLIDVSLP
jgi:hypothetical protein